MSSKISAVSTKNAPAALSVYSQAIVANGFVYCSGTSIHDPWSDIEDKFLRMRLAHSLEETLKLILSFRPDNCLL